MVSVCYPALPWKESFQGNRGHQLELGNEEVCAVVGLALRSFPSGEWSSRGGRRFPGGGRREVARDGVVMTAPFDANQGDDGQGDPDPPGR